MPIKLKLTDSKLVLKNAMSIVYKTEGVDIYDGDYEVTPKTMSEVILPTSQKMMKDDVTVKKMPQFEVSNEADGITLILGDEYYGY